MKSAGFMVLCALIGIGFWVAVIYVAVHLLAKYW